jgi:signal peptidase complex subunit 1
VHQPVAIRPGVARRQARDAIASCAHATPVATCPPSFTPDSAPLPAPQIIGWIVGYIQQDFKITCYFLAFGSALSAAVCLPDWPWWNRHPLDWLPARSSVPLRKKRVPAAERKSQPSEGVALGGKQAASGGGSKNKASKSKKAS